MKDQKIKAIFTFEMLGRPAEHLKATLSEFVDKLETIPSLSIENKTIHEPKPIEDEKVKDLFTTFAEVEVSAEGFDALLAVIFNLLPAHVEIIEPHDLTFANDELSNLLSDLTVKLHKYDEVVKRISFEKNLLNKKLIEADIEIKKLGGESILKNTEDTTSETEEKKRESN